MRAVVVPGTPNTCCQDGRATTVAALQVVMGVSDCILYAASHREALSSCLESGDVASVGACSGVDVGDGMAEDGARGGSSKDSRRGRGVDG